MKKLVIVIVIILVVCLVLLVAAPFLIDLDRYKTPIRERVQASINRDVDFEHIELTVLTGLGAEIQGLRISDNPAFSSEDFIRLDGVQVKVELLPLLKREVRIRSVILKKPVISIIRNAEGLFSFDDILATLKKKSEKRTSWKSHTVPAGRGVAWAAEDGKAGDRAAAATVPVRLDDLRIVNGKITYRDEAAFPGAAPLVVDNLNLRAENLSLDTPMKIDLSADLMESGEKNLRLAGTLGPLGPSLDTKQAPLDVSLSLKSIAIGKLPLTFPVTVLSGTASADVTARGSLGSTVVSAVAVDLAEMVIQAKGKTDNEKSGPVNANIKGTLSLDYPKQHLSIEKTALTLNKNTVVLNGTVTEFLGEPRWEVAADADTLEPAMLTELYASFGGKLPGELAMEGPVRLHVASSGRAAQFDVAVEAEATKMGVAYGELFRKPKGTPLTLAMKGNKEGPTLSIDTMDLVLNNLIARASGNLQFKKDAPKFAFQLDTRPVALDGWDTMVPLLAPYDPKGDLAVSLSAAGVPTDSSLELKATSGELKFSLPPPKEGTASKKPEPGMLKGVTLDLKSRMKKVLTSRGTLTVDSGKVQSIPFSAMASDFAHDPEQIKINSFKVAAFDGTMTGTGVYSLKTKEWAFTPAVEKVDVDALLVALTEHKGVFAGKLTGRVEARGSKKDEGKPSVTSKGDVVLAQGEWKNFSLVDSVLENLFGLKGVSQFFSIGSAATAQHATTRFDSLEGIFDMSGNIVTVKPLVLKNIRTSKETDSVAQLGGTIDILQKTLDMKGAVLLSKRHSEKLTQKADILKALVNKDGMMVLPITLKGAIRKPVPFLDVEYVMNALSNYYLKKGVDRGLEKLREKLGPAGDGTGPGKAVEEILKGFF